MNVRSLLLATLAGFAAPLLHAETPELLHEAIGNWLAGKEDWALTQRVRELADDGTVKQERVERYDPSLPDDRRWHLIEVDGHPPTEAERQALERKKNQKPRKHANHPPEDFLDFPHAVPEQETAHAVTYAVSVRPEAARLVQTDKLIVLVTVGKESRAIERVTVTLRDTVRVAFGFAKITGLDFDVSFDPATSEPKATTEGGQAGTTAHATLSRLGERLDYEWSDFKRVATYQEPGK
ncbi:MAG TPA: hypothetical protein VG838_18445 [Opitutaceae bacterium]|nr:hypothetical protein [Opitutaceae bacterium]